jgi:hypothetical protein
MKLRGQNPVRRTRQGRGTRNGQRTESAPDAAVADALDRLLDPLENLLEEFPSERPTTDAAVATRTASIRTPARPIGLPSLSDLVIRLRYSRRSPYWQVRQILPWSLCVLTGIAIAWLVAGRV